MTQNMFANDGEIPDNRILRKVEIDPILANGLHFTEEDLAVNRKGLLSSSQQMMISQTKTQLRQSRFPIRFIRGIVAICILIGWFFSSLEKGRGNTVWFIAFIAVLLIITLFFILTLLLALRHKLIAHYNKPKEKTVLTQTGIVILDSGIASSGKQYHRFTLNNQVFQISREGFLRFKHLERYTIYYLPKSKIIVSAEPAD